jgi:hypothetical protein
MMGTEVLNVSPKRTEDPAANPAVRARSFWEATSPTNAHPKLPTNKNIISRHLPNEAKLEGFSRKERKRTSDVEERPHAGSEDKEILERFCLGNEA